MKHNDIDAILRSLGDSIAILSDFVTSIPGEELKRVRCDGCWSIAQHVAHLADVQPMGLQRISRMLDEDNPEFVPYFPDKEESEEPAPLPSMSEALAAFKKGREAIIERLSAATPEDWNRLAVHPEYQQYGVHIFARHILMHDHWHMYRMEELWLTRDEYFSAQAD
ncbi:DinB family protein [Pseudodesulfovibrio sp. zrk46]|uniref:DinB family protein n=1 Tax=Pseudodesulfovibrio sp. zrk46 TaxID=2725288 RepID=UPI001449AE6B|nr:DinB family protein [Pseudodesulfovibrio sp. zrk46]QJB56041.1 DinB family protein [Pseudodesulfovibrio sp. zrk46]